MAKKKQKNAIGAKAARLLRRAVAHIQKMPLRYDQAEVVTLCDPGEDFHYSAIGTHPAPKCGTAGCLAGWIAILKLGKEMASRSDALGFATKALKLHPADTSNLFSAPGAWLKPFSDRYYAAKTPRQVAKVLHDRVEHFIKTGE